MRTRNQEANPQSIKNKTYCEISPLVGHVIPMSLAIQGAASANGGTSSSYKVIPSYNDRSSEAVNAAFWLSPTSANHQLRSAPTVCPSKWLSWLSCATRQWVWCSSCKNRLACFHLIPLAAKLANRETNISQPVRQENGLATLHSF